MKKLIKRENARRSQLLTLFFMVIFFTIAACSTQNHYSSPMPMPAAYQTKNLLASLHKAGVQSYQVGDEIRIILPNKYFFIKNTPTLQTTSFVRLNEIIVLLNQNKNYGINVVAYTPCLDHDFKPNISLAEQQAQAIVDYFLQQGLNTRLITASAWRGVTPRQRLGTGCFADDPPRVFSVEIRTRLRHPEDYQ